MHRPRSMFPFESNAYLHSRLLIGNILLSTKLFFVLKKKLCGNPGLSLSFFFCFQYHH